MPATLRGHWNRFWRQKDVLTQQLVIDSGQPHFVKSNSLICHTVSSSASLHWNSKTATYLCPYVLIKFAASFLWRFNLPLQSNPPSQPWRSKTAPACRLAATILQQQDFPLDKHLLDWVSTHISQHLPLSTQVDAVPELAGMPDLSKLKQQASQVLKDTEKSQNCRIYRQLEHWEELSTLWLSRRRNK